MATTIHLKNSTKHPTFSDQKKGDWFTDQDGELAVRLSTHEQDVSFAYNAVYFSGGNPYFIKYSPDHPVIPREVAIVEGYQK